MKKKLSLLLSLAPTLSLTACGGQANSPSGSNTPPAVTPPAGAAQEAMDWALEILP